jgi:hypothetical protein
MRPVLVLSIVLTLAVSACGIDLTESPRDTPARLFVTVASSDSSTGVLRLNASFTPGFDQGGAPRETAGDTLDVGGVRLAPTRTDERGEQQYSRDWPFTAGSPDPLVVRVRAPEVEGLEAETPELNVRVPHRVGPPDLSVSRGDPIQLRMADVDMPADSSQITSQLKLQQIGGGPTLFKVQFEGAPPSVITIPAEWIPQGTQPRLLIATVTVLSSSMAAASDRYTAGITMVATSSWSIHLQ